ncbi:MAG: TetR/AcrR family transcriptional regulator [Solobacterium sp.]|nr:TetR/AcrR family transcriptional regulator [Solobacterium sp.]
MPDGKDNSERKNEFIETAEKLFMENGIVDTTVNSIVKELDVAKGLFYYYFDSKDDVIEAISKKYNEIFNQMMMDQMQELNYEDKLKKFIANSVKSFRALVNKLQGKSEGVDLMQLSFRSKEEAKMQAIGALTDLLEEGNDKQEYMFSHTKYYANILIGGMLELIEQGEASDKEIEFIIFDLIERAGKD